MKFSLYQRLSLSMLLVFIAVTLVFYYWSQQFEQKTRYQSKQVLHLSLAANLARDNPLLQQGVYDHDALKNLFHTLMVLGPAFEFYFVDPEGNLLTHSIAPSLIKRKKIDLTPLLQLTQNKAPLPIYGDDPRHNSRTKIFSAAPVFNGTNLQGYLYVIVAGEQYELAFNRLHSYRQTEFSIVLAATALMFLFIFMLGLFRYFTHPLRQLSKDMQAIRAADFDSSKVKLHPWKSNDNNEVHQLGKVFAQMVDQLNRQFSQLQKNDEIRKELLAEISHDLRTPLSSLQGYLETIALKKNTITDDEREQFLTIALANANHLNRLIDQVFELAHLEGGQVSLNTESFNLTELLYDVVAKFALKAQKRNITLKVSPEFSSILVYSDIGKLERVISNLIDNALRHSDEGAEVILAILDLNETQCQLVISDTGTGIKAEELAYIFDARYRASNATQGESKHVGLGLAITQKLLELLKSEIKVSSRLGAGTSFTILLRKTIHRA